MPHVKRSTARLMQAKIVKGCGGEGAGAAGGNARAKDQWDPAVGHVKRVAEKGLWQDVEDVDQIKS